MPSQLSQLVTPVRDSGLNLVQSLIMATLYPYKPEEEESDFESLFSNIASYRPDTPDGVN